MLAAPALLLQQLQRHQAGSGHRGGQCGGVNIGPALLDERLNQRFAAGDEGAGGSQGLAQGGHQHRHFGHGQAGGLGAAASPLAHHPEAVGVVHHQPGIVIGAGCGKPCQGRRVAVHTEHPVHHHQLVTIDSRQPAPQRRHIAVGKALETGAAVQAAIEQGGVIQAVLEHVVPRPQQTGQNAGIGGVTTGKQQRPGPACKSRQRLLELVMRRTVPAHQVGGTAAYPVAGRRLPEGGNHPRVGRQAQIVIAAEVEVLAASHAHHRPLGRLQRDPLAVQAVLPAPVEHRGQAFGKRGHA